tara:strand:+ start:220 stop:459 length:240 start_codon:yes stop_codon:yes gene_type:complete
MSPIFYSEHNRIERTINNLNKERFQLLIRIKNLLSTKPIDLNIYYSLSYEVFKLQTQIDHLNQDLEDYWKDYIETSPWN